MGQSFGCSVFIYIFAMFMGGVTQRLKTKSRIFLRDFLLACTAIKFAPFGVTKKYFSDGMCHFMANDVEQNIKWLLKDE